LLNKDISAIVYLSAYFFRSIIIIRDPRQMKRYLIKL